MYIFKSFLHKHWILTSITILAFVSYIAHKVYGYEALSDVMTFNQAAGFLFGLITQPMLQLLILLVTGLSSFFMIRGVMKLSPVEMARISAAHLDYNPKVGENFAMQKADTVTGFVLLTASLLIQILAISQPLRWVDVDGLGIVESVFVLAFFAIVWWNAESWRRKLIRGYSAELNDGLKKSREKE